MSLMLASAKIVERLEAGSLEIRPYNKVQLRGVSYVLRLGNRFRRWVPGVAPVRLWSPAAVGLALAAPEISDTLVIEPAAFVLGCTLEHIRLGTGLAGQISPLSHVARFGLGVTCGADLINPEFGRSGASMLTLELFNHNVRPLELRVGMPVAHLRLIEIDTTDERVSPQSIYEGADPLTDPLLHEEWSAALDLDTTERS